MLNEEVNSRKVDITKKSAITGLLMGGLAMVILYVSYFLGLDLFVKVQTISTFIPYMIIIVILMGLDLRKENGNYLTFKDALKFSFLSYVWAAIITAFGTFILYNLIDPDLTQKSFEVGVQNTISLMENLGTPQDKIDEAVAELEKAKVKTDLGNILVGTGTGLIWDFVKSLLISIVIRREQKEPFI